MKKAIYILLIFLGYTAYSQSLSLFNIDATNFPNIKANFYGFDADGNQLSNLPIGYFALNENVQPRKIIDVSCPNPKPPLIISSVLVMDVSGSMSGSGLDIAKAAAKVWVDMLPNGKSECAITSFSDDNYLNQDFTVNKLQLLNGINSLNCMNGTNYNAAMLNEMAGGLIIAKNGKYKRVLLLLSDGEPNFEPKTDQIISTAIKYNVTIYCVAVRMKAPQCMKDFSEQTGGLYFENIRTREEAEECYRKILMNAQGNEPCTIEWESGISCVLGMTNVELKLIPYNLTAYSSYQPPNSSIAQLDFTPPSLKLLNALPGIPKDTFTTITARNANFNITDIKSSNSAFSITPTSFTLNSGESKNLKISFLPADSGYVFTEFDVESDICPTKYFVGGGFPGKKTKFFTLKLIQPNGGEIFTVGSDTVITWEGVSPDDQVDLEYSINNGLDWLPIKNNVNGLSYNWRIPNTPSNKCLARVWLNRNLNLECHNTEVQICGQTWMGCNLDVDTYRDGTPIPEVTDPGEWVNLTTGAWCYYNNDPANGPIYGKLYNWYAVNDPRGLAPEGWHISSEVEWGHLDRCLGSSLIVGEKLKSTGTIEDGDGLWYSPNDGATNESGFSARPGGWRYAYGAFGYLGSCGYWWTSTAYDSLNAQLRGLSYINTICGKSYTRKAYGFSVRCVKD